MSTIIDFSGFSDDQMKAFMLMCQQQMESRKVSFDDQVSSVQQQRFNDRMKELERSVAAIETVNAAFEVCLNEILGDLNESRWIVSQLDKCRRENDFRRFSSVYFKYRGKDLKVEEMLRTLAAIYRLKTKSIATPAPSIAIVLLFAMRFAALIVENTLKSWWSFLTLKASSGRICDSLLSVHCGGGNRCPHALYYGSQRHHTTPPWIASPSLKFPATARPDPSPPPAPIGNHARQPARSILQVVTLLWDGSGCNGIA